MASDTSLTIATNDQTIQTKLGEWQAVLNATAIFGQFQAELTRLSSASLDDQLRLGIHGKLFWEKEVLPKLSRLLGQCAEKQRRSQFFKQIEATDLQPLIAAL